MARDREAERRTVRCAPGLGWPLDTPWDSPLIPENAEYWRGWVAVHVYYRQRAWLRWVYGLPKPGS